MEKEKKEKRRESERVTDSVVKRRRRRRNKKERKSRWKGEVDWRGGGVGGRWFGGIVEGQGVEGT